MSEQTITTPVLTEDEIIENIQGLILGGNGSFERFNAKERETFGVAVALIKREIKLSNAVDALSNDIKGVNRSILNEDTLVGFNMAISLFNKHFQGI